MKSSWTNVPIRRALAGDMDLVSPALCVGSSKPSREESRLLPEFDGGNVLHPSGERKTEWNASARLSLTVLPEDIIVAILCHSLTPWDLISISHVSLYFVGRRTV